MNSYDLTKNISILGLDTMSFCLICIHFKENVNTYKTILAMKKLVYEGQSPPLDRIYCPTYMWWSYIARFMEVV